MSEIRRWLQHHGLAQYARAFEAENIEPDLLPALTDQNLHELGISSLGHRLRLFRAIHGVAEPLTPDPGYDLPWAPRHGDRVSILPGERRQATILFSDLSGYTAMNERIDPEEVLVIVGRIKAQALQIVERHGGVINQFAGDQVMAVFGVPEAHEDDPVRAVRAANELHAMVRTLSPSVEDGRDVALRLHSGISAGLVVTGTGDPRDGVIGVVGDAVNTGARLCAYAKADAVLVSEEIQRLIGDYFTTQPLAPVELKGKAGSVRPYLVTGATGVASRFEAAARRGLTPFAGRASELAQLQGSLEQAREGRSQFVSIIGEPGIGKSRLLLEYFRKLSPQNVNTLIGHCRSYGSDVPYLPMADALRRALGVDDVAGAEALHDHVVSAVQAISPALCDFLAQYLHLLSIPSATHAIPESVRGAPRRRSIEHALAMFFVEYARHQPLVLVYEDWHWVDKASAGALKYLCTIIPGHPIQVILTCRTESAWESAYPQSTLQLVLRQLDIQDSAAMLRALWHAENLPALLVAKVHERTAGNPLFNEEIARSLTEDDRISVICGRAESNVSSDELNLPDTVHAVVQARVDRLPAEARSLLRVACVVGREFTLRLLERLHPAPDRIPVALEVLVGNELIHALPGAPETSYSFNHALVQDAVYARLLKSQRKQLHLDAGTAIESLYDTRIEAHYEALADHYSKSDNTAKTLEYLEKAGNKAESYSSFEEARGYYRRLIRLLDGTREGKREQETRVRITLKWAEIGTGCPDGELPDACARAVSCAQGLQAHGALLSLISWEAHLRTMLGEAERGLALARLVISEGAGRVGNPALGRAHGVLGMSAMWSGKPALALDHARRGRSSLPHGMGAFWERYLLIMGGLSASFLGDFEGAAQWFAEVLALPAVDRSVEPWVHVFHGYALNEHSRWAAASESSGKAREIAKEYDDPWPAAWALVTGGYARFMHGEPREGYAALRQGVEELSTKRLLYTASWACALLAEATLLLGETDRGARLARMSHEQLNDGDQVAAPSTYRALALAAALQSAPDWGEVMAHLHNACDIARCAKRLPQVAITYFRYAECLHSKGDFPDALVQLTAAEGLFSQIGMPWWRNQAAALRSRIEGQAPFVWFAPYAAGTPGIDLYAAA